MSARLPRLATDEQVAQHLACSLRTLRRRLRESREGGIRPPVVHVNGRRWIGGVEAVEGWLVELGQWQASRSGGRSIGSGGGGAARTSRTPAPHFGARGKSSARSKRPSPRAKNRDPEVVVEFRP